MWVKVMLAWFVAGLALVVASREWTQQNTHGLYPTFLQVDSDDYRTKRTGHSLSVANPIEVLRNKLILEYARRRMQKQGEQNREFLKNIGKRNTINRLLEPLDEDRGESIDYFLNNSAEWDES